MAAGIEVARANPAAARLGWSACGGRDQEGMEDWRRGVETWWRLESPALQYRRGTPQSPD